MSNVFRISPFPRQTKKDVYLLNVLNVPRVELGLPGDRVSKFALSQRYVSRAAISRSTVRGIGLSPGARALSQNDHPRGSSLKLDIKCDGLGYP
jgi:hypothetical protein